MTRLTWGEIANRYYTSGVDRCVLYPKGLSGIPWNGVLSITEDALETSEKVGYLDGQKYRQNQTVYNFSGSLKAITYPEELTPYKPFDFIYRTNLFTEQDTTGYEIHILYNVIFNPEEVTFDTVNEDNELAPFSWTMSSKPQAVPLFKPSSHFVIRIKDAYSWIVPIIEDILYGTEDLDSRLPSAQELVSIFEENSILRITDHEDGTWTAETREGYDDIITMLDTDLFEITWSSALYLTPDTYIISSY